MQRPAGVASRRAQLPGLHRRYWIATIARVFGIQFRFIGSLWLVTQLSSSPIWLGIVSVASAVPTIVLSVPAGVLADRFDNRRLIVWSQALTAVCTLAMALAVVAGVATVWLVVVWSVAVGSLMAIANPAQNAILPRLIEMRAIASAVAYTNGVWNVMRIVGPAAAGVLIVLIGTGQAFFVTAAGFGISAVLIQAVKLEPVVARTSQEAGGMLEGIRYIFARKVFFATIGLSFFTSLFGTSYVVLLPTFATSVLNTGARGFGFMEAAAGLGALLGTVLFVRLGRTLPHGPAMLVAATLFGLLIAGFAASRSIPLSLLLLFGGGFASSVYLNIGMTALQILVPDELRGRVMGIWSMTYFLGSVGGLPAGIAAQWWGAPMAVALGALSVSVFAVTLMVAVPSLRRMTAKVPSVPTPAEA
ncbi:MAG TPA: MFS transporter [Tepidiformaceae bacterium]